MRKFVLISRVQQLIKAARHDQMIENVENEGTLLLICIGFPMTLARIFEKLHNRLNFCIFLGLGLRSYTRVKSVFENR